MVRPARPPDRTPAAEATYLERAVAEFEPTTIARALAGDAEAGRDALELGAEALETGRLSPALAHYLAERLRRVVGALDEAEALREVKRSSGSVRSARDTAIAEALCIKRPASKPKHPLPDWQVPYAAFGALLLNAGLRPEAVKAAMDDARRSVDGKDHGLDRREATRILAAYKPMLALDDDLLTYLAGRLRGILPTYLPQR